MDVKSMTEGSKIRQLRESLGLRRTEFGAKIGYSYQQVERVEEGRNLVSDELWEKICSEYRVSREWFVNPNESEALQQNDSDEQRRKRMRQVYKESGLTQREFGRYTHTATSMLNDVISGRKPLTINYARKLEATLGVGVDWLLYGEEEAKEYPCDDAMIKYIKMHPDLRKEIRARMETETIAEQGPGLAEQ